jgi:hypothetical protein
VTDADPLAAPTVREAARVAGWGLAFWGAVQLAGAVFTQNATALVAVQAALAEWGAGRVGITWSDPLGAVPSWAVLGRRAGIGVALGGAAATLVVAVSLVTHAAAMASSHAAVSALLVGLVIATLSAVRDELLLRGVVLRVTRGLWPTWGALAACGAAAAAARFGVDGVLSLALLVEALRGVALGTLWVKDRGAWMAVGANAAWTWGLGSVVRGALLDVRFATEADASVPALVVVAAAAVAACVWALPRRASN